MQFESVDELNTLLNEYKKSYGRYDTNCYLSLDELSEYINCGRLRYTQSGDTIWLFEKEKNYDIGYFYVAKDAKITTCHDNNANQVVYLIGQEENYRAQKREEELLSNGFSKHRKNLEYKVFSEDLDKIKAFDEKCTRFMSKFGAYYSWMSDESEYGEIFNLWRNRIDTFSVKYHLPSEIRNFIEKKECMVVRGKNKEILAACCYSINGVHSYSENIAVKNKYNGSGIGAALIFHSWRHIFEQVADNTTYIWEENIESRRVTEKVGRLTGRFSQMLVM